MGCSASAEIRNKASAAPRGDYRVYIDNELSAGQSLGLTLKDGKSHLLVEAVRNEGLVRDWNQQHEFIPEVTVQPGDMIIGTNNIFGRVRSMKTLLTSRPLVLIMKRPMSPDTTRPESMEEDDVEGDEREDSEEPSSGKATTSKTPTLRGLVKTEKSGAAEADDPSKWSTASGSSGHSSRTTIAM